MRRRDAMSVRPASPIPLFDRKPVNPFAPIGISAAVARSVGQGRRTRLALDGGEHGGTFPFGRGRRACPKLDHNCDRAGDDERFDRCGFRCAREDAICAGGGDESRQSLCRIYCRGVAAVWHSGKLDTSGDACRKSRPGESRVAKRRDWADADHARYLGRIAAALPARARSP